MPPGTGSLEREYESDRTPAESLFLVFVLVPNRRPNDPLMPFLRELLLLLLDKDSALLVVLVTLGNESTELSLKDGTNLLVIFKRLFA